MTTPTQAQVEAAARAMYKARYTPGYWGGVNKETHDMYCEMAKAALTAAAQVGEEGHAPKYFYDKPRRTLLTKQQIEAATIERCAQVVEGINISGNHTIAAAIRKLKDKPKVDPNIIYPGKDPDFVFPEEA